MTRIVLSAGLVFLTALLAPACGGPGAEDDTPTGVVVDPPETLDFGTVSECTEWLEEIIITNYGPDDVDLSFDVNQLIAEHFLVSSFSDMTLEAEDEHSMGVRLAPEQGHAGLKEANLYITAGTRSIQIRVIAEVVEGDEC